jgi:ribosomal protein S18 acetylase RimI-like enzyme
MHKHRTDNRKRFETKPHNRQRFLMQEKLKIRHATPSDWERTLPLFEQLYHGDIGPDLRNVFTTLATSKENCIFVAQQDEKLVGALVGSFYLDIDWEGKIAKLQAIVVDEPCRRHEVGGILLQHFLNHAKKHHARVITARVNRRSREALLFYKKLAFTKTETTECILELKEH